MERDKVAGGGGESELKHRVGGKQDENSIVCYRGTSAFGSSVTIALMISAPLVPALANGITYLIRKPISWNSAFPFHRLFVNYRCTSLWSLSPTIGYCLGTSFYVSCLIQVRVVSNSRRHVVGLSHFDLIADLFQTAAPPLRDGAIWSMICWNILYFLSMFIVFENLLSYSNRCFLPRVHTRCD